MDLDKTHGMHLVLGKISDEALESLRALPSVTAVVLHVRGKKKGEHPHWHVWLDVVGITNEAMRKRLRTHNALWREYSGNEHWSLRAHNDYSTWATYVTSNPSAQILIDRPDDKHPPLPPVATVPVLRPLSTTELAAITVLKPKKSMSMRAKFLEHLSNKGWSYDSICLDEMTAKKEELIDELTDYWENAFTTPQGAVIIQHAMYVYGNEAVRTRIKQLNSVALNHILRC